MPEIQNLLTKFYLFLHARYKSLNDKKQIYLQISAYTEEKASITSFCFVNFSKLYLWYITWVVSKNISIFDVIVLLWLWMDDEKRGRNCNNETKKWKNISLIWYLRLRPAGYFSDLFIFIKIYRKIFAATFFALLFSSTDKHFRHWKKLASSSTESNFIFW